MTFIYLFMSLVLFFEVEKWEELEDCWEFRQDVGGLKSMLVEEDISFMDLHEKFMQNLD